MKAEASVFQEPRAQGQFSLSRMFLREAAQTGLLCSLNHEERAGKPTEYTTRKYNLGKARDQGQERAGEDSLFNG